MSQAELVAPKKPIWKRLLLAVWNPSGVDDSYKAWDLRLKFLSLLAAILGVLFILRQLDNTSSAIALNTKQLSLQAELLNNSTRAARKLQTEQLKANNYSKITDWMLKLDDSASQHRSWCRSLKRTSNYPMRSYSHQSDNSGRDGNGHAGLTSQPVWRH